MVWIFAQLLAANLLLNTGITLVTVPHAAISAELTKDAAIRIRIFAARLLFANLGLIVGLLVPAALIGAERDAQIVTGNIYAWIAVAIGLFCLFAVIVCTVTLPNKNSASAGAPRTRLLDDLQAAAKNRFFVALFASGFLAYIAVAVNSTLARYYYDHYLKLGESQFALVLIVFILVWSMSVVLWVKLADRFGKDRPAIFGIVALGIMTMVSYPLFPAGSVTGPIVAAVFGGIFTGCILLFDSYVADAADLDFAQSNVNREGLYFGVWKFGIKASRGVAVVISGFLLWGIGYRAGVEPDAAVKLRIALLFGPLVGSIFVLSGLVFHRFAVGRTAPRRRKGFLFRPWPTDNHLCGFGSLLLWSFSSQSATQPKTPAKPIGAISNSGLHSLKPSSFSEPEVTGDDIYAFLGALRNRTGTAASTNAGRATVFELGYPYRTA